MRYKELKERWRNSVKRLHFSHKFRPKKLKEKNNGKNLEAERNPLWPNKRSQNNSILNSLVEITFCSFLFSNIE